MKGEKKGKWQRVKGTKGEVKKEERKVMWRECKRTKTEGGENTEMGKRVIWNCGS